MVINLELINNYQRGEHNPVVMMIKQEDLVTKMTKGVMKVKGVMMTKVVQEAPVMMTKWLRALAMTPTPPLKPDLAPV